MVLTIYMYESGVHVLTMGHVLTDDRVLKDYVWRPVTYTYYYDTIENVEAFYIWVLNW